MKVLLLGEFSGLHRTLRDGLLKNGHEAIVAGWVDGFKKIEVDISFESNRSGYLAKLDRFYKPLAYLPAFRDYDVVQVINPFFLKYFSSPHKSLFPTEFFYRKILKKNKQVFVLAAGDDAFFWQKARTKMRYGPFEDFLKYDLSQNESIYQSPAALAYNESFVSKCDGVIPVMYEYALGYENSERRLPTIPIPVNTEKIAYEENKVGKKIVVFHGLNRYGFKGTRHVENAFEILRNKYPNDLELIIDGKMALDSYLKLMKRANIVIDQTNSYSCGMNAVFAMAMGKIVLGGAEPESLKTLGVLSSPVINIEPNANSIVSAIEHVMERRSEIPMLGLESRLFVEEIHDYQKVANQFVSIWSYKHRDPQDSGRSK